METHKFENLFNQILSINTRFQKINELTGENFNVFRIIKLESAEVRMHSAFIAELLNPSGSHGQKDIFLKLFIKMFCFKNNDIDTTSCKVYVEKYIGAINQDKTQGGQIDIFITDKYDNHIIIENKIYATDQVNQLLRYNKHSPNADLIYLSLDGKEPEEYSTNGLKSEEHYRCRSYSTHISEWLEECRKEVTILPIIRESITQYLNLIKYLTNQTLNDTMKEEVATLLSNNLEASFIISDSLDDALKIALDKFYNQLRDVASELNLKFEQNIDYKFNTNYRGFSFAKEEWNYVFINFQFQAYDKDLIYGFSAIGDDKKPGWPIVLAPELKEQLKVLGNPNDKKNAWWPVLFKFEDPYNNWSKYDTWKAIQNGEMAVVFREKIVHLLKESEGIVL